MKRLFDKSYLHSSEFYTAVKELSLRNLFDLLLQEHGLSEALKKKGMFKCAIGYGNNPAIVKAVIKQRTWWCIHEKEDFDEVDFLWTQWAKRKHISRLPKSLVGGKKHKSSPSAGTADNTPNTSVTNFL